MSGRYPAIRVIFRAWNKQPIQLRSNSNMLYCTLKPSASRNCALCFIRTWKTTVVRIPGWIQDSSSLSLQAHFSTWYSSPRPHTFCSKRFIVITAYSELYKNHGFSKFNRRAFWILRFYDDSWSFWLFVCIEYQSLLYAVFALIQTRKAFPGFLGTVLEWWRSEIVYVQRVYQANQ